MQLERWSANNGHSCSTPHWVSDDGGEYVYRSCADSVVVSALHCGTFFLWQLPQPPRCDQAYCTERSGIFSRHTYGSSGGVETRFTYIGCYVDENPHRDFFGSNANIHSVGRPR